MILTWCLITCLPDYDFFCFLEATTELHSKQLCCANGQETAGLAVGSEVTLSKGVTLVISSDYFTNNC